MPVALVLFDIDGTLLRRTGPHHRLALIEAIRRVTGLETTTDHIPLHGMLDPDIISRMLRQAGAPQRLIREAMPAITREAEAIYERTCPDLRRKTCPGVRRLLRTLESRGAAMGLVTGNLTRIGWKKLERAGLRHYFRLGAFGEMRRNRAGLVRLALAEARRLGLWQRGRPVSLIGDAPADVEAARVNRIRAVAVATGITPKEELAALQPDLLFDDLRQMSAEELLR
ncbi:MAG: HAD hydrolase-like protein [Bryobacterales bacterium]|nr:HAD family hydrolase [Bryobacteraceae bacterium]MDW8131029.1 HAD hydrolase-like protein [Bryobacterales bacterium]